MFELIGRQEIFLSIQKNLLMPLLSLKAFSVNNLLHIYYRINTILFNAHLLKVFFNFSFLF